MGLNFVPREMRLSWLLVLLGIVKAAGSSLNASFQCGSHKDCESCAGAASWLAGASCRWCPADKGCHDYGDIIDNSCPVWENIVEPAQCGVPPMPQPFLHCGHFTDCDSCTSAVSWLPGSKCRWCPKDGGCHDAGDVVWNHCHVWENIKKPQQCGSQPSPPVFPPQPEPTPETNDFVDGVLKALFKHLQITDVDTSKCANDVGGAKIFLHYFAQDVDSHQWGSASVHLSRAISSLSTSVADCGIVEVQHKLDTFSKGTRWANITTVADKEVKIIVGASDLWRAMMKVASAVRTEQPEGIGKSLGALLDKWSAVTGGCGADAKVCGFLDGLLRVISVTANNEVACKAVLAPAISAFEAGSTDMHDKNYSAAVEQFAAGLDITATAVKSDACGLKHVADALGNLAPILKKAQVSVNASGFPTIAVGSADVYLELRAVATDVRAGDYAGAGIQMGALLAHLRASQCSTKVCIVLEGMLASLQVGLTNLDACSSDLDDAWWSLNGFIITLQQKQWKEALSKLGDFFGDLGTAANKCGVPQLGRILQDGATKMHKHSLASVTGHLLQLFVSGSDVALDFQKMIVHALNSQWEELGKDLGRISDSITNGGCHSFVCNLAEGILMEADMALTDLKPCVEVFHAAEDKFAAGAVSFTNNQPGTALGYWGAALNTLGSAMTECGVAKQLNYLEQEANVLRLGNATVLGDAAAVLLHGKDFYQTLYAGLVDMRQHDFRSAGQKLGKVLKEMNDWTNGHLCSSGSCYVLNGIMQYLQDLEGDISACVQDLDQSFGNFSASVHTMVTPAAQTISFSRDSGKLSEGLHSLGLGLNALADAVSRCHLATLAALITKASAKLGLQPAISWLAGVLQILIDGKDIIIDTANACLAFSAKNWPGFGYDVAKLMEKLIEHAPSKYPSVVPRADAIEKVYI